MQKSQVSPGTATTTAPAPNQKQVRLSKQQQDEPVGRQLPGAFKKELARAYGIHVETVRAIIQRYTAAQA